MTVKAQKQQLYREGISNSSSTATQGKGNLDRYLFHFILRAQSRYYMSSCGHILKDNAQRSLPLGFKCALTAEMLHKATPAALTFRLSGILPMKSRYKLW